MNIFRRSFLWAIFLVVTCASTSGYAMDVHRMRLTETVTNVQPAYASPYDMAYACQPVAHKAETPVPAKVFAAVGRMSMTRVSQTYYPALYLTRSVDADRLLRQRMHLT